MQEYERIIQGRVYIYLDTPTVCKIQCMFYSSIFNWTCTALLCDTAKLTKRHSEK
jgi:hypothetical protein